MRNKPAKGGLPSRFPINKIEPCAATGIRSIHEKATIEKNRSVQEEAIIENNDDTTMPAQLQVKRNNTDWPHFQSGPPQYHRSLDPNRLPLQIAGCDACAFHDKVVHKSQALPRIGTQGYGLQNIIPPPKACSPADKV
jgi:hypothetical protein